MPRTNHSDEVLLGAAVVGRASADELWPIQTKWRAAVEVQGELRAPEWVIDRMKPVPLSSRVERSLLDAVRSDDGRAVLAQASEPGEHRTAAAVIAALRLAGTHPDRSLRFLGWLRESPDDPQRLRFLRRYLPELRVLVRCTPEFGLAVPLGRDALDLLAVELLAETGQVERAANLAATLTPSGPVALTRAWLRLAADDFAGTHELAQDRPVVDDVSAALRVLEARALSGEGDHDAALTALAPVLELPELAGPVEEAALGARRDALRASGREVEAQLISSAPSSQETSPEPSPSESVESRPGPPLFGRSVTTAMEDAWARVRREPLRPDVDAAMDDAEVQRCTDDAVALIASDQFDAAESHLLAQLDRADAWVDAGGPVLDELYVLLAGLFNQREMTPEEVATLERLRAAHQRSGSPAPSEVEQRLVDARAALDQLA